MIFDSHAHYDREEFDEDREELLTHMKEKGIGAIVNVGASMTSTAGSVELAHKYENIYASAGVHPCDTYELTEQDMLTLEKYTTDSKVVAVGEIGLDYHYPDTNKELQEKWFTRQLDMAVRTKLPVIIHSRDAANDTMNIMKKYQGKLTGGVIHCYSYSADMAKEYVKMGYYIGIGGVLTFKNGKKLKETAQEIPIERIVLETDCPYLSPEPNRGQRNDSTNIKYVVKVLADIKGMSEEEIESITFENALRLYGMEKIWQF